MGSVFRSEIRSVDFRKGRTYRFSVDVNFDAGTTSSNRTTFFQIHQYKRGSCTSCGPAVIIKTNGNGSVTASVLKPNRHHSDRNLGLTRSQIAGKWTTFTIELGTNDGMNPLTIYANGRAVYSGQAYVEPKGSIYLKSGLYRPGSTTRTLPTDRVSIRKLRFETVK
ncbi:MAG: heparin lyase I family protein [Bacteroidota bacterium]